MTDAGRVLMAFGGRYGDLAVRDVGSGTWFTSPYYGQQFRSFSAVVARDGRTVAVLSEDPDLLYDLGTGRVVAGGAPPSADPPGSITTQGPLRMWMIDGPVRGVEHTGAVRAVAAGLRAGQPVFASGGDDGTIRFRDPGTGRTTGEPMTVGRVSGLAFLGGVLVTSGEIERGGSILRRWDSVTGKPIGEPLWRTGSDLPRPVTTKLDGRGTSWSSQRTRRW